MSLSSNISEKAAFVWAIVDKLTGVYKSHEYGEVILPLTVIRRFDCVLADTKDAVIEKYESVKALPMKDILLRKAFGHVFFNTIKYNFERLLDDHDNNDRKIFMLLFEKDFPEMAAARYEQNKDFFVKMLSDPDMMKQVMDTIGSVLYERLKKKIYYYEPKTTLSMVVEDSVPYGKKEQRYSTRNECVTITICDEIRGLGAFLTSG